MIVEVVLTVIGFFCMLIIGIVSSLLSGIYKDVPITNRKNETLGEVYSVFATIAYIVAFIPIVNFAILSFAILGFLGYFTFTKIHNFLQKIGQNIKIQNKDET